ncbi:MAG: hypothetical protein JO131_08105, partial [Gammaproteobacteria bacterium]|nr:hypothetical protein [Gammaproteobacteria bacterium]
MNLSKNTIQRNEINMIFPRIFSISTVGILKHYNQDYLIHPVRTDFTGSNGIGKSIIADLLQLIFISDEKLITFGTEGINPEERRIYSLPYKTNEAYAFLNLEVKKAMFLTIGVCIPSRKTQRIRPFVVLSDTDHSKTIEEISYSEEKLLTHQHFIIDSTIPSIEDLSIYLRDKHQLFLKYFTTKEDKQNFYTFLYKKEILPINLTIENNLKAFAKIIQSFSKARSLDISSSKSLQDFLFEDNKSEYSELFLRHKLELQGLLIEYQQLNEYISELEKKQKALETLKVKEITKIDAYCKFLLADLRDTYQNMHNAQTEYDKIDSQLEYRQKEKYILEKRSQKFKRLIPKITTVLENKKNWLVALQNYKEGSLKLVEIQKDIDIILHSGCPDLNETIEGNINVYDLDSREIVKRITDFNPLFNKYNSLGAMEKKYEEQKISIDNLRQEIKRDINDLKMMVEVLSFHHDNTLFIKALESGQTLTAEQEIVLLHLIDVAWERPTSAEKGSRYTDNLNILQAEHIEIDKQLNGLWLHLGNLREFIPYHKQEQLFNKPENFQQALENTRYNLEEKIKTKQKQLKEIENFEKGQRFNIPLSNLDQRLRDYSIFEYIRETAFIIKNVHLKITSLRSSKEDIARSLDELTKDIPLLINISTLDIQINNMELKIQKKQGLLNNIVIMMNKEEANLDSLKKDIIPILEEQHKNKYQAHQNYNSIFTEKETRIRSLFPDLQTNTHNQDLPNENLDLLEKRFRNTEEDYITEYKLIVNTSPETQNRNNYEVNEQLNYNSFNFSILEKSLLGSKIKHFDDISDILRENNIQRQKMADTVYQTMLKIFSLTKFKYREYQDIVRGLNTFFKGKKISNKYFFQVNFISQSNFGMNWIDDLQALSETIYRPGQLA